MILPRSASQLTCLSTTLRIRISPTGTASAEGSTRSSDSSPEDRSGDDRALRFSFLDEVDLRALGTPGILEVRDNLRFLALRAAISLRSSAFVSSEKSDPAEDEPPVPSSPPESCSLLCFSSSVLSSPAASSSSSTSESLAFLAAIVVL